MLRNQPIHYPWQTDIDSRLKLPSMIFRTLIGTLLLLTCAIGWGQQPPPKPPSSSPNKSPNTSPSETTSAQPESPTGTLRERVNQSELDDEGKAQILKTLDQADTELKEAASSAQLAETREAEFKSVKKRLDSVNTELESLNENPDETAPSGSLTELEAKRVALDAKINAAKQNLDDAEAKVVEVTQRPSEIDAELPGLVTTLEERQTQLKAALAEADRSLQNEAIAAELKAAVELLNAKIVALQNEKTLLNAEATANLPQLSRDLAARRLEILEKQSERLKTSIEQQRVKEAAIQVDKANVEAKSLHPALKPIGTRNQELADLNQSLVPKIKDAETLLAERSTLLEELRSDFEKATNRVDNIGLTDAVGAMLRNLKQRLPNVSAYQLQLRQRAGDINDANYKLMEMTEERNQKVGIAIDSLLRNAVPRPAYDELEDLRAEARELYQQQRSDYLAPAIQNQNIYFSTLVSISTAEQEIIQLVEKSTRYIDENVLWIRSSIPLYEQYGPGKSETWFLMPSAWSGVIPRLIQDLKRRWVSWCCAALALFVLIRFRYRLRAKITEIGESASQGSFAQFTPTMRTLLLTIATAAPVPVVSWYLGSRFQSFAGGEQSILALASAFHTIAFCYFPLELMRQVCRPHGLAESHFHWPPTAVAKFRRHLRLVLFFGVPLAAIASFMGGSGLTYGNDVLERYFSIAALAVLTVFSFRTLHPRKGAPARLLAMDPEGWANRLAYLWYPLANAIPILLIVLSFLGYHFTSLQLGWRVFASVCMLFAAGVAVSMVMRWSLIHRRRLRMEQARETRSKNETDAGGEAPVLLEEQSPEELQDQMMQSRNLFRTAMVTAALMGLWAIWSDVVPALGFFEKWPAWTTTASVTEVAENEQGELITTTRDVIDKVTYAELGIAILVLVIASLAAKNLPGLLEFALLRRLPLDRSARYAITTLVSYAIILIGLVIGGGVIGLQWSQIQWMATALTFGLAFGLQEMFANFVAGIIILFEQPVRVGDVVEIDGVTGIVSRIRIRATTITDWERRDYIVPNKEFITGKVLNWTRSDEVVRVTIPVGIAYGSDTHLARRLITEVAESHPDILEEPACLTTFEGFGDNTLNMTLRAFVNTYQNRLKVIDDLHTAIDNKFREADIEISFPQRDLHLRSMPEALERFLDRDRSNQERADRTKEATDEP